MQPHDGEYRTFRVGPMSDADFNMLPEPLRANVEKVASGAANENDEDVSVIAPQTRGGIGAVVQEVLAHGRRFLYNSGLHQSAVVASVGKLQVGGHINGLSPEELFSAARIAEIHDATIEQILFRLSLPLEEILINHAMHGNKDPRKIIGGNYWINAQHQLRVASWDEGNGFNTAEFVDPTLPENLGKVHGRGRLLAKSFPDGFIEGNKGLTGRAGTSSEMWINLKGHQHKPSSDAPGMMVLDERVRDAVKTVVEQQRAIDAANAKKN
jgi:hypothetical protein